VVGKMLFKGDFLYTGTDRLFENLDLFMGIGIFGCKLYLKKK